MFAVCGPKRLTGYFREVLRGSEKLTVYTVYLGSILAHRWCGVEMRWDLGFTGFGV